MIKTSCGILVVSEIKYDRTYRKEVFVMGDFRVQESQSACVQSPEEMIGRFQAELMTSLPAWKARLRTPEVTAGSSHSHTSPSSG